MHSGCPAGAMFRGLRPAACSAPMKGRSNLSNVRGDDWVETRGVRACGCPGGTPFALPPGMSESQHAAIRKPAPTSPADIERRILEILRERQLGGGVEITRETRFHELGDSLDRVEVVMEIEEEFEVSIPDDVAETLHTLGEMIDHLAAAVAGRARGEAKP